MNTIEKSSAKEGHEVLMLSIKKNNEEASEAAHLTKNQTKYFTTYFKKEETVFVRRLKRPSMKRVTAPSQSRNWRSAAM